MLKRIKNKLFSYKYRFKAKLKIGNTPDFLILGAQKAGTTSLFKYIEKYADNFQSPKNKELSFFTERYDMGIDWYKSLFPKLPEGFKTGEATPCYLFYHKTPERVVEHLPHIKFIVLLRNPVDRAYSQYYFQNYTNKTKVYDPLDFESAIKNDIYRYQNDFDLLNKEFSYIYKYFSYIRRGIYYDQIKRWFKFFPKENFLFIKSEDFFINTEEKLREIFRFLELNFINKDNLSFKTYNKNKKEKLDPEIYSELKEFYKPFNEKLYELIDYDMNW